jgi:hypothetical protein
MTPPPQDESPGPAPAKTPSAAPVAKVRQPGDLVAHLERVGQQKAPPPKGRGIALLVIGGVAVVGAIHTLVFGGPVGRRLTQQIEERERQEAAKPAPLATAAPGSPAAPTPTTTAPAAVPSQPAAPSETVVVAADSAEVLALAALRAPADRRESVRRVALEAFAEMASPGAHRRTALENALRLANDAVPEEAEVWGRITEGAIAGLDAPADAGLALLYLATLRERAGEAGTRALERVVDDERRPLEQRCAAARTLPEGSRAPLLARLSSRRHAHPELLRALR